MESNKLHWAGKWIWVPGRPAGEKNIYAHFRKTFDIESLPNEAIADISADSKYMLFVNGQFVNRGIPMCDPLYQYFDQVDIAPYLKPGKNVIAAYVHHYGVGTSKYQNTGRPGFLFEAKIGDKIIATDASWKSHIDEAYIQNVPRLCELHMLMGFQEHFDARNDVVGWKDADYDDSEWLESGVLDFLGNTNPPFDPWPQLTPRDIPLYFEEERPAKSIHRIGEVDDTPLDEKSDIAEKMFAEPMREPTTSSIENAENMISWDDNYATITQDSSKPENCPSVIIDFGKEVTGMIRIEIEGAAGTIIDIAHAELVTKDGVNHCGGHLIGMGLAHRYIMRNGRQVFETFGRFGLRYLQLTFRNTAQPVKVHRVSINFSSYDVGDRGKFESSDKFLNDAWQIGAYTAQCCMYDGWEDCPGREQRQWVGDARVEALINYACFGDLALTRKFLIQLGQGQRSDGMTMMFYPGCLGVINGSLSDYNLQWIPTINDYYLYSGEIELVKELYPKVGLSLGWWEKRQNEDGLLENVPSHIYLDLCVPPIDAKGIITVMNCLYLGALRSAANMAHTIGDKENMRKWLDIANKLANAINDKLFDKDAGVYADSYHDGALSEFRSQHANLLPLFYDIVPSDRIASVWEHITNEDHLCRTKQEQEQGKTVAAAQPFFTYFLFEMFAKRGRFDIILEMTRRLWKPLVESGHGTFWEQWYDPRDDVETGTQTSMCHAWSGTPTYHLSSDILGVRPTSPGFATFDIQPHALDLKYAKGIFPSVKGDIAVSWDASEQDFNIEFTVPDNTKVRVILPVCNPKSAVIDGKETTAFSLRNGAVEFAQFAPGKHIIKVTS